MLRAFSRQRSAFSQNSWWYPPSGTSSQPGQNFTAKGGCATESGSIRLQFGKGNWDCGENWDNWYGLSCSAFSMSFPVDKSGPRMRIG
jgi:hypothetical protein